MSLTRRDFLRTSALSLGAMFVAPPPDGVLRARPSRPSLKISAGMQPLGMSREGRDGFLYVPPSYDPAKPAPLVVLLHGAGQSSAEWARVPRNVVFDDLGIIALVPDSRGTTWDIAMGGFGPDVEFIDRALAFTFNRCAIDPTRIALGGFSDGASYALSLGATNGDLFTALMAFSPGFYAPAREITRPKVFVAHGTADGILSFGNTRDRLVPRLRSAGFDVTFSEFTGGHMISVDEVRSAMRWFAAR